MLVTVSAKGRAAVSALADATNKPMATVVGELIEEAAPMLHALAEAAQGVRTQKADAYRSVALALAQTQMHAAQLSVELHGGKGKRK